MGGLYCLGVTKEMCPQEFTLSEANPRPAANVTQLSSHITLQDGVLTYYSDQPWPKHNYEHVERWILNMKVPEGAEKGAKTTATRRFQKARLFRLFYLTAKWDPSLRMHIPYLRGLS